MHKRYADAHVLVAQQQALVALRHEPRLLLAQAVDHFCRVEQERLPHLERRPSGVVSRRKLRAVVLVAQHYVALFVGKHNAARLCVNADGNPLAGHRGHAATATETQLHSTGFHYDWYAHLFARPGHGFLIYPDNVGRVKLDPHVEPLGLKRQPALRAAGLPGRGRCGAADGRRHNKEDFSECHNNVYVCMCNNVFGAAKIAKNHPHGGKQMLTRSAQMLKTRQKASVTPPAGSLVV